MYSPRGNFAFMSIVALAAILSATCIFVLGLSGISLAVLIALTFGSVVVGKLVENWFEAREEADREKQVAAVMDGKS